MSFTPLRFRFDAMLTVVLVVIIQFGAKSANAVELSTTPIPIESFFEFPNYGKVKISPNTKMLAATARLGERMCLVIINIETQKITPIAAFDDADISWFTWINDRRLVFDVWDQSVSGGDQPGHGLFAIDADGGRYRGLMPTFKTQRESAFAFRKYRSGKYLARVRGTDDILYQYRESGQRDFFVMRMNTRTGREQSMVIGVKGEITHAMVDSAGELRAVVTIISDGQMLVWYRPDAAAQWKEISRFAKNTSPDAWMPIGVSVDGKTLWVGGRRDRDTAGIHAFDLAKGELGELTFSHPSVDVGDGLVFDRDNGELLGLDVEAEKSQTDWFNADWARAQATVDAALPQRVNRLSGNAKSRLLVRSYSDRDPGRYYLYDVAARSLSEQLRVRPKIDTTQLSPTRMIYYQARDQLKIPAYFTVPKGAEPKNLPLVVLVHGGPYLRDSWGFDGEVQFLASRGYAVLQPQFRGSTGFGDKLFRAGWKTWGMAMQDDLTDGVQSLVRDGVVYAKRVCIMGASYGGYAALMGVAKDPDLYRCAISFAGVTDIGLMFSIGWSDFAYSLWADFGMTELIGDPNILKAQFIATSPIEQASKIKVPVLLSYGLDDYRVPLTHGEKMHATLKSAGVKVEWKVFPGEGHGLSKPSNRYEYYRLVEAFLKKYLPAAE